MRRAIARKDGPTITWATIGLIGLTAIVASRAGAQCELQKLTASDAAQADQYGFSIDVSQSTLVVGAAGRDGKADDTGAAYVYTWNGSIWTDEVILTAPDAMEGDAFAWSVGIDGEVIVCAAPGDDEGAVHVFRRIESAWTYEARLQAVDGRAGDSFGRDVAISGDAILVGASKDDENGFQAGAVYVFRRSGSAWSQEAKLLAPDAREYDAFGGAVAIDGAVAIIGAPGSFLDPHGRAFVFRFDDGVWRPDPERLVAEYPQAAFGGDVDIDGDLVLVGAANEMYTGTAYAFRFERGSWVRQARLTAPDGVPFDAFGSDVALEGPNALIGAKSASSGRGVAHVFDTTTWEEVARVTGPGANNSGGSDQSGTSTDLFGSAVTIDGDAIIVGAYLDDDDGDASGSAWAYAARGPDCNDNGRGDCLDIVLGASDDCNGDGRPDECAPTAGPDRIAGRRTILVPADHPTIQAALDAAEDGDEVVVANGTYTGEGNFDLTFRGKAVVLRSEDCDPDRCIIDCANSGRGFVFDNGETAATQVSGFTIMRGRHNDRGGGIYIESGRPTITNCTILLCNAVSMFASGGGLYSLGDPTFINCTFHSNQADPQSGTGGGAVMGFGRPTLVGCSFIGNSAASDGALLLYAVFGTTVRDCVFLANRGFDGQGALRADELSRLRVVDCIFDSNVTAGAGGGFLSEGADCTIERCVFRSNFAGGDGGAMYVAPSSAPNIHECLFRENVAQRGGGIFNEGPFRPSVRDSRLCGNAPTNIEGPYSDGGGNEITVDCTGPCPADVNGDSFVGMFDLLAILSQWGPCTPYGPCSADIDGNEIVDFADLLQVIGAWGPCPKE